MTEEYYKGLARHYKAYSKILEWIIINLGVLWHISKSETASEYFNSFGMWTLLYFIPFIIVAFLIHKYTKV